MSILQQNTYDGELLKRLARQQEALATIGRIWRHYDGNLELAMNEITETASRVLDIERVSIWYFDKSHRKIVCEDLYEATPDRHTRGLELYAAEYPEYLQALESMEVIPAEDALTEKHTRRFAESYLKPNDIGAMLDAPIRAGGELAGVLCFEHVGGKRKFHWDEMNTARYLSNMLGAAIEFQLRLEENKRVEELLQDKVTLWHMLFEQSMDAIVILNKDGSIYQANKQYADMLGYSLEEISKLYVWDWDCKFSKEEIQKMLHTVDTTGDHFETKHRRKDGTIIDVELSNNGAIYKGKKLAFCIVRDITERKRNEEQLRKHKIVVENSNTVLFRWRAEPGWPVDLVSDNVRQFGYEPEDLMSGEMHFASMVHPDDLERVAGEVRQYDEAGNENFEQEYRIVCPDGRIRWIYDRTVVERGEDGRAHHFQGIVIDITERKEAEEKLRRSEERFQRIASQVPGVLFQFSVNPDGKRNFPYISEGAFRLGGISSEELMNDPDLAFSIILSEDMENVETAIAESASSMQPLNTEFRIRHRDGSVRWISGNSVPYREPDDTIMWNGILMDITERKKAEEQLRILSTTDGLTGITNRKEFTRILEKEIERSKRYDTALSVIMYDLDHFKNINDNFGHHTGDDVLCEVTTIVNENIRSVDLAGRWGGEEFVVMLPQTDLYSASNTAEKLRRAIENHSFDTVGTVTASFGVAELESGDDADSLLKKADDALYKAKRSGRNRVEISNT